MSNFQIHFDWLYQKRYLHPYLPNYPYSHHNQFLEFLTHLHNFHKVHKQNQILLQQLSDFLQYHSIQNRKPRSRKLDSLNHKQTHHRQLFDRNHYRHHHRLLAIPNDYLSCGRPNHQILHPQIQHKLHLYCCNN